MRAKWISQGLVFVASLLFLSSVASATAVAPGIVELRGNIDAFPLPSLTAPQSFSVNGQLVVLDVPATTKVFDFAGVPQASMLPVVSPGVTVHVKAVKNPDGSFTAFEIDEEATELEIEDVELTGAIDALDPATGSFTMGGMEINTDTNTEVVKGGNTMQLTDLAVGMIVEVKGSTLADQPFIAATIKIEDGTDRKKSDFDCTVKLQGIGDNFVMEMGRRVGLAASTKILGKGNKPLSFAELHLGTPVHVQAVEKLGHVLDATKLIAPNVVPLRAKRLTNRITKKTSTSIKVGKKVFMLPIATLCKDGRGKAIAPSKLRRGMEVRVDFVTVDGVRVARVIQKR
jgi:hypothetical protein